MVTIKLNLTLIKLVGKKELEFSYKDSKILSVVLDEIGLSPDEIGMVIKNDRWVSIDCLIEENDVVQLFPHLEGG